MSEQAIKFFGREVTLREIAPGWIWQGDLGPSLKLRWSANELVLIAGASRLSPAASGDTLQRAAENLEAIYKPVKALFEAPKAVHAGPVPMALHCPKCSTEHVDPVDPNVGPHREHCCESCNFVWTPCDFDTVGVPGPLGVVQADVSYFNGGHDGPGWYYWESGNEEFGVTGSFESFEAAARDAIGAGYVRVRPPLLARPA